MNLKTLSMMGRSVAAGWNGCECAKEERSTE